MDLPLLRRAERMSGSSSMTGSEQVLADLTEDERELLCRGLVEWGGPARCTQELAIAMGFRDVADLLEEKNRLEAVIRDSGPLSRFDWTRALVATEFVFVSNIFGSGRDWQTTTGFSDEDTIRMLRQVQRKLPRVGAQQLGTRPVQGTAGKSPQPTD